MLYDMNGEPGHKDVPFVHVDLSQYQPGQPQYERLMGQLAEQKRFSWPDDFVVNV